jgi:hypothetical protein
MTKMEFFIHSSYYPNPHRLLKNIRIQMLPYLASYLLIFAAKNGYVGLSASKSGIRHQ